MPSTRAQGILPHPLRWRCPCPWLASTVLSTPPPRMPSLPLHTRALWVCLRSTRRSLLPPLYRGAGLGPHVFFIYFLSFFGGANMRTGLWLGLCLGTTPHCTWAWLQLLPAILKSFTLRVNKNKVSCGYDLDLVGLFDCTKPVRALTAV